MARFFELRFMAAATRAGRFSDAGEVVLLSSISPSRFGLRHVRRSNIELRAKLRTALKLTFLWSKALDPNSGRGRRKRNI
jgi:hypothetical protein